MGNDLLPAVTALSLAPSEQDPFPPPSVTTVPAPPPASQVPALLWTTNGELRVTWVSGAAGSGIGAALARPVRDLFGGETADVEDAHRRALLGETAYFAALRRGADVDACVAPLKDFGGSVVGTAGAAVVLPAGRRRAEEEAEASREQLRRLAQRLQEVREQEQERIGREVHDEIGQRLAALRMDLAWLQAKAPGRTKDRVVEMIANVDETIAAVRRVARQLRPPILERLGLHSAIRDLAERTMGVARVPCDVYLDFDETLVDRDRGIAVYRIVQEALTNVLAHAKATRAAVNLRFERGALVVQVLDDGRGIGPAEVNDPRAMGLAGMRERVAVWGGEIEIRGDDAGTTVVARIPLSTPGPEDPSSEEPR